MKMTRLEWRYLQRIALDHPYFDTHKLPLTEKEAKAIVEANITMTGREFVDSIYAKLGMTRSEEEKKRFAWLHNIGELFTVPPIRKIAIAVLVVVLMTVFFAATPTGRAIAESVIHYIATLFEDGSLVVNQSDNETILYLIDNEKETNDSEIQEDNAYFVYVDSFEEFSNATGKVPYVLPLPYSCLYYEHDELIDYLALYASYDSPNGQIITYQVWDVDDSFTTTLTGFTSCDADESIFYSVEDSGYIYCKKICIDSYLAVTSKGNYTIDNIIEMLKDR
jgi:hypothetical protein